MGVQIFNKDVSVISSIKGIAKVNISNVAGIGGWSGGGGGPGTQGPNNPGSARDAGGGDNAWDNVTNVFTSNNQYATSDFTYPGSYTNYIQAYNFGFSIPIGAIIDGIEVTVEAKTTEPALPYDLGTFNLWKGLYNVGTSYGTDFANITLSTVDGVYTIGSSTSKWNGNGLGSNWDGQTITSQDINDTEFSVIFGLDVNPGTISIDHITMKIYYTV